MDPLDKQLAHLKLMTDYALPSRVCPESVYKDDTPKMTERFSPIEVSPKKIGPAVPPKPNKKSLLFPEVPKSIIVKQTCEPLYSKRLQSDSVLKDMRKATKPATKDSLTSGASVPVLHRKPLNYVGHHIYSNNKITLDNPAVLDQQLEALEYHKKQLEKKGLLQNTVIPKLSTASFGNGVVSKNRVSNKGVYSNVRAGPGSFASPQPIEKQSEISNVYSNINHPKQPFAKNDEGNFVYSNVQYANNDELPPPPLLEISSPLTINDPAQYLNQCNAPDDDIPPPPSPVSSSYSELRRATDIFPKLPSYPITNYGTNAAAKSTARVNNLDNKPAVQAVDLESENQQQTYINVAYHLADYGTYGSSNSQKSLSQSAFDCYGYGSTSQGSSTYESIYEPINPRPTSQLSSRSNYLPYAPYVNSPPVSEGENSGTDIVTEENGANVGNSLVMSHSNGKMQIHKEVEVETLTDLLVHSMDAGGDVDSFGICVACNERIVGENSGCTAMDQVYHIACFTCSQCQINLQGKPFYALDGKPYCEGDYLNTLEKCSVCMKPILERILRATGKPYHPQCFTCVVCGNSLDGIPFTVDATNQNYCIADFHKKFAPRCCVCKLPIMPEPGQEETVRVVALDRSFHFECYKCEDCGLLLSSEAEGRGCYPLDDHVLCKSCNAERVQMLTSRMTTEL